MTSLLFSQSPAYAESSEDLGYDPYSSALRDEKAIRPERLARADLTKPRMAARPNRPQAFRRGRLCERLLNLPALPLDILRKGIDKTLVEIEEHHFEDKVVWFYEDILLDHGLKPKLSNIASFSNPGAGGEIDFIKLAGFSEDLPMVSVEGGGQWAAGKLAMLEGTTKVQILEPGPTLGAHLVYTYRPEEDFYGIGPNTSLGDATTYEEERTILMGSVGYSFTEKLSGWTYFSYRNVNINLGHEAGKGAIEVIFPRGSVPGLGGGELISVGGELMVDTRDSEEDPKTGGLKKLSVSFHEGVENFGFTFFKYRAEIAHYFQLPSRRQNIAFRFLGEHNDEVNQRPIPFFDLARLGGYGTGPRVGDTHRGFRFNRFFGESEFLLSLEYRYAVYEYREWNVDAVIFWDEGQVFNEFSEFQFKDFQDSAGVGFRLKYDHKPILNIEIARSDEGLEFYVRSKSAF